MITVSKIAGFCNGVKNAFNTSIELSKKHDDLYMVGELVHNESVVQKLEENNIKLISQLDAEKLDHGTAIIKAGGVRKGLVEDLKAKGVEVYDLTCPVVKKIHDIISQRSELGEDIILIGNPNHDEVQASITYASGKITVVPADKLDSISIGENPTAIVFQTTILPEIVEKVDNLSKLSPNFKEKSFVIYNTVCYTTTKQQRDVCTLAQKNDTIIVIGDKRSSNTKHLFEVAKNINKNTYFVDGKSGLDEIKNLKESNSIAITAGASTPPWLIEEVLQSMSEKIKKTAEAKVEETTSKVETTENLTMEDLLASESSGRYVNYRPGSRVTCTVIRATDDGIYVDIGGKKDGFVDKTNASMDDTYNKADYKKGDKFTAVILDVKEYVNLSKKAIDEKAAADEKYRAGLEGQFDLKIDEVEKDKGLRGKFGPYSIFVPASQIKSGYVRNLDDYLGKTLKVELLPLKKKKKVVAEDGTETVEEVEEKLPAKLPRSLVASARIIIEKEKKEKEDLFWNNIHVHDIVTGKVKRYTEFGAFVNVRGYDCLAHVSELSWNKITDPSKVIELNKEYDFVVLKVDRESGKISLGYKQLQKKPYELAAEQYPVGTIIKGTVERIFPYGAFISIADGVDGLVHVSQISHNWIKDANEALKVGEEVEAKIIGFDDNRITLSIKELLPEPEVKEEAPAAEEEAAEKKPAKSRSKKFEERAEGATAKKPRAKKEEKEEEPKQWVSGSSSASFGDLLKGLDLKVEEEEKAEKATKKKK